MTTNQTNQDPAATINELAELDARFARAADQIEERLVKAAIIKPLGRTTTSAGWDAYWQIVLDTTLAEWGDPRTSTRCDICDNKVPSVDAEGFCKPCVLRHEGMLITESAAEELKSLERHLEAQRTFFENATDAEILESARRVKRLIEAHGCLEDAGTRSTFGL